MADETGISIEWDAVTKVTTIYYRGERYELQQKYDNREDAIKAAEAYCRHRGWQS